MTDQIGTVTRVAFAERLRAVFRVRAGDQLAAQDPGAFRRLRTAAVVGRRSAAGSEAVVFFPKRDAGARRDRVFPPFEAEFVVVVADEEEGGGGAVGRGIGEVGIAEVGEGLCEGSELVRAVGCGLGFGRRQREGGMYLHMDLHGSCFVVFEDVGAVSGVVAVEPGAVCPRYQFHSFSLPRGKYVRSLRSAASNSPV